MVPCRICKRQVARSAKLCPGCGVQYPANAISAAGNEIMKVGCGIMLLLPFALLIVFAFGLCA